MNDAPDTHEGMTRMLFVDAIFGVGFPNIPTAEMATQQGLAKFAGNQHMEAWVWDRSALEALGTEMLQSLYIGLKMASLPAEEAANAR